MDLVLAPFLPREQPALGVSTLAAALQAAGEPARVRYLNLGLASRLGATNYDVIANFPNVALLGEMVFTSALWGDGEDRWEAYVEALSADRQRSAGRVATTIPLPPGFGSERFNALLRGALRELFLEAPAIVDRWADEILAGGATIVGLSSTFQQNVASLALAQALRRRADPERLTVVMGGANCEGAMGEAIAARFPFVDHVVSGEADGLILELARGIRAWQAGEGPRPARWIRGAPVTDMDALPIPVFDDYLAARAAIGAKEPWQLAAETARGCWWGARSHCRFCGLNANGMAFRSKSPARATRELRLLRERYQQRRFMMADNILDWRYLSTVLVDLAPDGLELFWEVKSNLRPEQVGALADGGVRWIQPGVESLSTPVLARMGKGATALQQVSLLRSCRERDVKVSWNLLYNFPGDRPEEYAAMVAMSEALLHLPPPSAALPIRLDRFSPYFEAASEHGIVDVRPAWAYSFVYHPLPADAVAQIAYFFDFAYAPEVQPALDAAALLDLVRRWGTAWSGGARLTWMRSGGGDAVYDSRFGRAEVTPVTEAERAALLALDRPTRLDRAELPVAVLDALRARRWIVEADGAAMSVITRLGGG